MDGDVFVSKYYLINSKEKEEKDYVDLKNQHE
jgi:hypothetical protein